MSLNVALNVAVSGLFANQRAISATSENIANVNTPDFVRRETTFVADAIPDQFSGVTAEVARASTNSFLASSFYTSNAENAAASISADALSRVETSLGAPGDNTSFANRLAEAFASLTSLSAIPTSEAAKAEALFSLEEAFRAFGRTQDAIAGEQNNATTQIGQSVSTANSLLNEIFNLNQIASQSDGARDLISTRVGELSALLPISATFDDDGRAEISTTDGILLVNTGELRALGFDAALPTALNLVSTSDDGTAQATINADISGSISGGAIGGQLALLNDVLPNLSALVEDVARGIATDLNAVYASNASVGETTPLVSPLIVETAGRFSINSLLLDNPASFAVARPDAGEVGGAADGTGAAALAALASSTAANDANEAIALIGASVNDATRRAETTAAFSNEISSRLNAEGGVNLDEELSNLILYQRSYNANARVIAAVDELWESLLAII